MSSSTWAAQALQQFETVVQSSEGFRVRDGQRHMAEAVAQALSQAQLGKVEDEGADPARAIAVIQAGTGVGKSLAYSVPAIAIALARGTRVLISTATVALQEQLVHKDLPQLAARMEQPFAFALAKGRGRYACKLKLERLASGASAEEDDHIPDDLLAAEAAEQRQGRHASHQAEARMQFYASLADALATNQWDGDRDQLPTPPEPEMWGPVAAEASSCTGKYCPLFSQCTYFERRKALVAAQVIGNHQAVTVGGMQGHLELNVFKPLIGANVMRSIDLLATGMEGFAARCVEGIEPNRERIAELVDRSLMLVTALAPEIGYDKAAKIAKHAHETGSTLRAAALDLGYVDAATFDRVVDPRHMLGPEPESPAGD